MRVFVWAFAPKPRMLVFGAIDFAAAVARVGSFLGYHVTVCDARPVFATGTRFPEADEVVVDWPHRYLNAEVEEGRIDRRTVITVLTHDPKFDVPLLEVALRLPEVAYIGAMGSRRTHDDRLDAAPGGRADPRGDRPPVQPDRARPRRPHARGDRHQHRRRDHRRPLGRFRRAAGRDRGADPPRTVRDRLTHEVGTGDAGRLAGRRAHAARRLHRRRALRRQRPRPEPRTSPPTADAEPREHAQPHRGARDPRTRCPPSTTRSRCPP